MKTLCLHNAAWKINAFSIEINERNYWSHEFFILVYNLESTEDKKRQKANKIKKTVMRYMKGLTTAADMKRRFRL